MKYRLVLVVVSGIWVLTSCIESSSKVQVEQDGSGTIELTRLLDTNFPDNYISDNGTTFSPGDKDIERICGEMANETNYPDDATIKPIERSPVCGVTVTVDIPVGGDVGAHLAEIEQAAFGPLSELFTPPNEEDYVVEQRDDQWIFKMPAPSVRRLDTSYLSERDVESILALSDFSYEISLPGTAIVDENNADNVVGGTFIWEIDPTNGPTLLEARTTPPSQNLWQRFGIPALVIAVLALTGAGVFSFVKSWRGSDEQGSDTKKLSTRKKPSERDKSDDNTAEDEKTPPQFDSDADTEDPQDPTPIMATLPLGSSSPEWNEDLQMWLSNHEVKGRLFFNEETQRWEPLR